MIEEKANVLNNRDVPVELKKIGNNSKDISFENFLSDFMPQLIFISTLKKSNVS